MAIGVSLLERRRSRESFEVAKVKPIAVVTLYEIVVTYMKWRTLE